MIVGLRYAHPYFLHLLLGTTSGRKWELIVVYAPPNATKRGVFWEKLDELRLENPWLLMGDFNCVLHEEEWS